MIILIVDDDLLSLKVLDFSLSKLGHSVINVSDAKEALTYLHSNNSISLLITDWIMPGIDGIELCKRARKMKREKYLPIILLTSLKEKKDLIEGLNAGADAFLSKPLNMAELKAHIQVIERILHLEEQLATQIIEVKDAHKKLKDALNKIEEIANTDELTAISNRRNIMDCLDKELERALRYGTKLSILIIDIDHFKRVNDNYGHLCGDIVLKKFALIIQDTIRNCDHFGRYGGEEFIGIFPETPIEEPIHMAERIREKISNTQFIINNESKLKITISIGVAVYSGSKENSYTILSRADKALYRAKESGRNRVCI